MSSDPKTKWRVRIALLSLFVFAAVASVGAFVVADLGKLQDNIAARESQAALQGITDFNQIDAALRRHPTNKFLRIITMATRAADETNAAIEKLSGEIEPAEISKTGNLGAAGRSDLEALRRDLKMAETNATTFAPRAAAVLQAERDTIEKYALSLHLEKDYSRSLLEHTDKRHAEMAAFASSLSSARADFYRAYQKYVGVLVGEFGSYKVVGGQFIFPLQRTVDRYNVAAQAMTSAARHVTELDEEGKRLQASQQARWFQFVRSEFIRGE